MTDDEQDRSIHDEPSRDLSRRDFVALSLAAGLAAAAGEQASAAELPVIETNVDDQDAGRHRATRPSSIRRPARIRA